MRRGLLSAYQRGLTIKKMVPGGQESQDGIGISGKRVWLFVAVGFGLPSRVSSAKLALSISLRMLEMSLASKSASNSLSSKSESVMVVGE